MTSMKKPTKKTLKEISVALHIAASEFRKPMGDMGWFRQGYVEGKGGWVKNGYLDHKSDMIQLTEVTQGMKLSKCAIALKLVTMGEFQMRVRKSYHYTRAVSSHGEIMMLKDALDRLLALTSNYFEHLMFGITTEYNSESCTSELIIEVVTKEHIDEKDAVRLRVRIPDNLIVKPSIAGLFK